jgi:hypothetical protein
MDLNTEIIASDHHEVSLPFLVQSPWNLGTQLKLCLLLTTPAYCSLLQLTTSHKRPLLFPINLRRGPTNNTSRGLYKLLRDVTAYAEVCLPLRCLATDVLFFRVFASAGTCLTTPRCLTMGAHVTISHSIIKLN